MKNRLLRTFLLVPLLLGVSPAFAQTNEIKQIQTTRETLPPLTIYLAPGQGITLAYGGIQETIETAWLDNRKFVGLSSDGCLTGLNDGCTKNEASALHLNLVNAQSANGIQSNRSLLTVVTVNKQGQKRYFLYNIYPNPRTSDGDSTKLIEYTTMQATVSTQYDVPAIIQNVQRSKAQGLIRDSEFVVRANKFVDLLLSGTYPETAAEEAGLSPRFLRTMLQK